MLAQLYNLGVAVATREQTNTSESQSEGEFLLDFLVFWVNFDDFLRAAMLETLEPSSWRLNATRTKNGGLASAARRSRRSP